MLTYLQNQNDIGYEFMSTQLTSFINLINFILVQHSDFDMPSIFTFKTHVQAFNQSSLNIKFPSINKQQTIMDRFFSDNFSLQSITIIQPYYKTHQFPMDFYYQKLTYQCSNHKTFPQFLDWIRRLQKRTLQKLKKTTQKRIQLQNMQKILSSINSNGVLEIANMKINSKQWQRVFKELRQNICSKLELDSNNSPEIISHLKSLCLINNRKPTIIKDIEFLSFPQLTKLSLDGNKIESIESFEFMHLPSLKQLFMYRNYIRSFKPLEKCSFPELYFLSIYDNFGFEMQTITRMKHKICRIWLQGQYFRVQSQDISHMIKFWDKKTKLNQLGIKSKVRILQQKVFGSIREKHKSVKILYNVYRAQQDTEEEQQQFQ